MLAAIATPLLNVRSVPNISGKVLGQVREGQVVKGHAIDGNWLQLAYGPSFGFVSRQYLRPINDLADLNGQVTTAYLNVRSQPNVTGAKLGTLTAGASVEVLSVIDDWLEIEFNQGSAFVAGQFVDLHYQPQGYQATVNTYVLNVRSAPNTHSSILGQLNKHSQVQVVQAKQGWSQIIFNGNRAYVAESFLTAVANTTPDVSPSHPIQQRTQTSNRLTPANLLPVQGTSQQRAVAVAWNKWGALLDDLSTQRELDVACSLAVVCVESSGKGFEQNNQNRMIIRFENHKFWKYWGRDNQQQFNQHFQYQTGKAWRGHKWRRSSEHSWQSFHGNQADEWQVFEFACLLDKTAAMLSISMGAPQIMGFHYQRIGYRTVEEMFEQFSGNIKAQLQGLFDFFSPAMIDYIQQKNFVNFAAMYNGSGQKQYYGDKIEQHYLAFTQLMPRQPPMEGS